MFFHVNVKNVAAVASTFAFAYFFIVIITSRTRFPDIHVQLNDIISYGILAIEQGGKAVCKISEESDIGVRTKGKTFEGRNDLLTKADLISNHLILETLSRIPGIKVISEESRSSLTEQDVSRYRVDKYSLWLGIKDSISLLPSFTYPLSSLTIWVDPLDATQEFTEQLYEYVTVMMCIAYEGQPVFGAIYQPFTDSLVLGLVDWGVMNSDGKKVTSSFQYNTSNTIVISRSHSGDVESLARKAFGSEYKIKKAGGSGYKILTLINHLSDIYLHRTRIKKWDTCAGDALVRAAGGAMIDLNASPLDYGRDTDPVNRNGLFASVDKPFTRFQMLRSALSHSETVVK
ncbi:hypothetical protein AB6A40_006917 [Gnathostoma spinigerum]|uniref:inositol-phosphate phosphatase n=1 Tax=Gnathostoma spinigerum TaxID=75299 RepID=A0ABD6EJZ4_9BILA